MSFFKGNASDSVREHGVEKSKRAAMPIWNYHRYFEGYVEHDIYTKSGKVKTERIYGGARYLCGRQGNDDGGNYVNGLGVLPRRRLS